MSPVARRLDHLRAQFQDLGPLRVVAVLSAVLPTAGLVLVLHRLADLAAGWPASGEGAGLAVAAITLLTGCMLLPPSMAALASGYVFGGAAGAGLAVTGIALGAVVGQQCFWPLVAARLYPFMRGRPRVVEVQRVVAGGAAAQVRGVAVLRAAARLPFAVTSLLCSAAKVPAAASLLGTGVGAAAHAWLLAGIGATWRELRGGAELTWPLAANVVAAAPIAALVFVSARRRLAAAAR